MDFIFTVINYGIMATLGAGFVFMGVACLVLISRNVRQGRTLRNHLLTRVSSLRMSKILDVLDIDFNDYMHAVQISSINQCMNQCERCDMTTQCDSVMTQKSIRMNAIVFCPILNSLNALEPRQHQAALSADACLAG